MVNKQYQNSEWVFNPFSMPGLIHDCKGDRNSKSIESSKLSQNRIEGQLNIDTDINSLSSRKLWQILQLCQIKQCELDRDFIEHVKKELILRGDYDDGEAWVQPH